MDPKAPPRVESGESQAAGPARPRGCLCTAPFSPPAHLAPTLVLRAPRPAPRRGVPASEGRALQMPLGPGPRAVLPSGRSLVGRPDGCAPWASQQGSLRSPRSDGIALCRRTCLPPSPGGWAELTVRGGSWRPAVPVPSPGPAPDRV